MSAVEESRADKVVFGKVWIADTARANSVWKFLVYDHSGELSLDAAGIAFSSNKSKLRIPWDVIDGVARRTQVWPWAIQASIVAVIVVELVLAAIADSQWLGGLFAAATLVLGFAAFGPSIGNRTAIPWAVVRYRASDGEWREAWFADGSRLGWKGISGGTASVQDAIASRLRDGIP